MLRVLLAFMLAFVATPAFAQTLTSSNVQITWAVANRFPFFRNPAHFNEQLRAYTEYARRVAPHGGTENESLLPTTSVLGIEHVLNDRFVPFTQELRPRFDWKGWAAHAVDETCYDPKTKVHSACGGVDAYLNPKSHEIWVALQPLDPSVALQNLTCHWRIGEDFEKTSPCNETISARLAFPQGGSISVGVGDEPPISLDAKVNDLLVVGLGDSFASGEGNPDVPVTFSENGRNQNLYPERAVSGARGSALWLDRLCHRSLYSYQMRAALQIAIENPHVSVTWLGHACSGAAVDQGLIGPQSYVESVSDGATNPGSSTQPIWGGKADGEIPILLRELCKQAPNFQQGQWVCPGNQFRRKVDYLLLSIGGNDIGFAGLVSWVTLRRGPTSSVANWLGATVSPEKFRANMQGPLAQAYKKLAAQLEKAVPLGVGDLAYDASRVILSAYPDILTDEKGETCAAITDGAAPEDSFAANQSLDRYVDWLAIRRVKLEAARSALDELNDRMGKLAEANGWTYAGRTHADKAFRAHGFCARDETRADDPAEMLMVPCFGTAARPTLSCQSGIFGRGYSWRPYDPATQNYPYALRQRWVRTINDAYMTVNQKVVDRFGAIDEAASARELSATIGAMHPNAEGAAALADAVMVDLRKPLADELAGQP